MPIFFTKSLRLLALSLFLIFTAFIFSGNSLSSLSKFEEEAVKSSQNKPELSEASQGKSTDEIFPAASQESTAFTREEYIQFFRKVFDTLNEHYYYPVHFKQLEEFIQKFDGNIYPQLKDTGKSSDYVRWRAAAYLVEQLRNPEDTVSQFFPPKPAEEFRQEVLGKRVDLGIDGMLVSLGFLVTFIEPRCDAYEKGLRMNDIILKINDKEVASLADPEVKALLNPLENETVTLQFLEFDSQQKMTIQAVPREFFQQTVFMEPVGVNDVYCLKIQRFNEKTAQDMLNYMTYILKLNPQGIILDLRDNPGGPPLAAKEISAFFLPPGEEFAYFHKKGHPEAHLQIPVIPPQFRYAGPLVILVNEKSGSSSELFSGTLQRRGRAIILGANTAGQVLLKSMFSFEDNSMVLLVTARGHFPDGGIFSLDGITPDQRIDPNKLDLIKIAANYLLVVDKTQRWKKN